MNPINFKEAQRTIGAGNNPNTVDLRIALATDPDTVGPVVVMSCWEPTEAEIAAIVRDKKIYVGVMSHPERATQPPIYVMGLNPFLKEGGYSNPFQLYISPIDQKIAEVVRSLNIHSGDYVRGSWRSPNDGSIYQTEGMVKAFPAGLMVESPTGATPLRYFIAIDELKRDVVPDRAGVALYSGVEIASDEIRTFEFNDERGSVAKMIADIEIIHDNKGADRRWSYKLAHVRNIENGHIYAIGSDLYEAAVSVLRHAGHIAMEDAAEVWKELTERYSKVIAIDSDAETINEDLTAWHKDADAFLLDFPEFKQQHEDFLKHA
jgi:hypothetical protein